MHDALHHIYSRSATRIPYVYVHEFADASLKPAVKLHNGPRVSVSDVICHHMVSIFVVSNEMSKNVEEPFIYSSGL